MKQFKININDLFEKSEVKQWWMMLKNHQLFMK